MSKTFLADPLTMLRSGWALLTKMGFGWDIGWTVWRVFGGFALAALLALPLGVAMGAYKPIEAFFEPFVSFARYLPASAFIPLLILWAGIGEAQKLALIFIGSFFQLVLMIAVIVGNTRRDLVEAAYTLGVGDREPDPPRAAARRRARDRRGAAHGARLGLDLRDRRRADRRLDRHRPHDHRQPGAARDRPDHLRDHRHRRDRLDQRRALQVDQPAPVPVGAARPMNADVRASAAAPRDSRVEYERRIHRVMAYIDEHLDAPLDLETLAAVAHFSAFHFHRLFRAWTGETLGDYLRRRRIETGALRLVTQPALDGARRRAGGGVRFRRSVRARVQAPIRRRRRARGARSAIPVRPSAASIRRSAASTSIMGSPQPA